MSFPRSLLSSSLFTGIVFSAATFPLAAMSSQPLTIHLENQPIFAGQVKELSGPYLGLATALSLGAGMTSLAVLSWSSASRKLNRAEDEVADLKQQLQDKENELEGLRFSENRLTAAGLESFLDEVEVASPAAELLQHSVLHIEAEPVVSAQVAQPQSEIPKLATKVVADRSRSYENLTSNHVQTSSTIKPASFDETFESVSQALQDASNPAQIEDLISHLKQVMTQMEHLKTEQQAEQKQTRFPRVPNTVWQQQRLAS